jgi:hypothetical protein
MGLQDQFGNGMPSRLAHPSTEWLPTDPPRPAPALLTAAEAVAYLRLSEDGRDVGDALRSLEYLVAQDLIRPCRVGRFNRYARSELDRFIAEQTERYCKPKSTGGT